MAKGKIDPIKLVRKSSSSKKFDKLDFEELNIKKDDFSIDDLKNNKKNESKFLKLKSVLDSVSSCQISDASNLVSGRSGVISGLKAMNRNKVYGRIVTAKTNCDDWGTSVLAMNAAEEGDVLFIYCYGKPASVWGELASTSSKESGIAGTILYGYSRDMDAIIDLDYPVYALDFLPNAGKPLGLGQINIDIDEFTTFMNKRSFETNIEEQIITAFKVFDKNEIGLISVTEFRHIMQSLNGSLSDDEIDELGKLYCTYPSSIICITSNASEGTLSTGMIS